MIFLLVIDQIRTGGAERILLDYHTFLTKQGNRTKIFVLSGNANQSVWTQGIEVIYGNSNNSDKLPKKFIQQLTLFFKLRKVIKTIKPDVIFSFLEKSNLITILVPCNAKKILSVHNILSIQYKKISSIFLKTILFKILNKMYNSNRNIIAVSKQVKDDLINSFGVNPEHIHVINNRVDKENIKIKSKEAVENYNFESNTQYILNIGRYSDQKAQWKLLKAFAYLKNSLNEERAKLILIGEGENKTALIKLTSKLNIQQFVTFLPFNTNPYKYMARADLFVLSSIYEGFPIVLAEISSLRIPFVGTNTSIPEEMFSDKNIWNSSVFQCLSITNDINTIIEDDEKALAKLIKKGLYDIDFRKKILKSTSNWESSNNKQIQFEAYTSLI